MTELKASRKTELKRVRRLGALALGAALLIGPSSPSQGAVIWVEVAKGTLMFPGHVSVEQHKYVADGCSTDIRDAHFAAMINVVALQGKVIEVRLGSVGTPVTAPDLRVTSHAACSPLHSVSQTFVENGKVQMTLTDQVFLSLNFYGNAKDVSYSIHKKVIR